MQSLLSTYQSVLVAVFQVFAIAFIAAVLIRRNIITTGNIKSLSLLTVRVFLPSLIFSKNLAGFRPDLNPDWWLITFWSAALCLSGVGIAWILYRRRMPGDRNLLPLAGLQNAGYIILPLGKSLFPEHYDEFAGYVFLVILGVSPLLWSLGKWLISPNEGKSLILRELITPPLIANILSISLVLSGAKSIVPSAILSPLALLGEAAVPSGLFILGALIGETGFRKFPTIFDCVKIFSIKFLLLPAAVIYMFYMFPVFGDNNLLRYVLVLEASSPPAVALILQAKAYKGDVPKIGGFIMTGYILAILFMPIWVVIFELLNN